jgi:hypothetical protein
MMKSVPIQDDASLPQSTPLLRAVQTLDHAVGDLEHVVARRGRLEASRAESDIENDVMGDDRARLAVELDSALHRVSQMEATTFDVDARVERAMNLIRSVLERAQPVET